MTDNARCSKCRRPLIYEDELESNICDGCADIAIERSIQARDWSDYHDGEPCPEVELTPFRKPAGST